MLRVRRLEANDASTALRLRCRDSSDKSAGLGEELVATPFLQRAVKQAEAREARRKTLIEATLAIYDHKTQQDCSTRARHIKARGAGRRCHRGAAHKEEAHVSYRLAALYNRDSLES